MMKYLVILADGMADYNIAEIGNQTPLQYAHTPNMDHLAATSIIGMVQTIPEGFTPGSDVANLSVMGYDPRKYYTGRSPLEAVSMGVELAPDDMAFRCNLVTLSDEPDYENKTMVDYSAGEITSSEAAQLIAAVQAELGNDLFQFYAGISYRHLMVWKGGIGRSFKAIGPHDISSRVVGTYLPQGPDAAILLDLMKKSEAILRNHPVNQARLEKGLKPATSIWLWGEGTRPALDSFAVKYNLKGSVVSAVDLVKGLGICAGLTPIEVSGATGGIETDFAGKARAALDQLKQQDFVYLHIESPDEAGHKGQLKTKIWSIEQIDQLVVGQVISALEQFDDLRVMLLPDHRTPVAVRTHTMEPVPFMIYDKNRPYADAIGRYDEESALAGKFFPDSSQLMDYFIKGR